LVKGVTIGKDIGRKASWYKGNGMIINTTRRRESLGIGKDHLIFREDGWRSCGNEGVLVACIEWSWAITSRMTFF
jgi:hypothetical protein